MTTAKALARFYGIDVQSAHYHDEGNWYWNLTRFPGVYFGPEGCIVFKTEENYRFSGLLHLSIGPRNTGIRHKDVGMSISDMPGYRKLDPPPSSLWTKNATGTTKTDLSKRPFDLEGLKGLFLPARCTTHNSCDRKQFSFCPPGADA